MPGAEEPELFALGAVLIWRPEPWVYSWPDASAEGIPGEFGAGAEPSERPDLPGAAVRHDAISCATRVSREIVSYADASGGREN